MKIAVFIVLVAATSTALFGKTSEHDTAYKKHFVSTSLWSVANLLPDPADFYELNFGYRFTSKDALICNATTWKYWEPLGIPLMSEKKYQHLEDYPGYVRAFGVGVSYQRFIWRKLYSSLHTNAFVQNFYDNRKTKIQTGFQLYLQFRVGYRVEFLKKRFFLEPALSFNYWPINTNLPASFSQKENQWPNYFLFEPHLNVGVSF